MTVRHLVPAGAASLLLVAALAALATYASRLETQSIHVLAPEMFSQKNQGVALQRAAFRQADLLPVYGSSDLNVPNPYHASALLRDSPSGFTVFPVGNAGSASLIWLQALAAVGADLEGRKLALSLPARSFMDETVDRHAYAANFSRFHASELAFSTRLSFALKQEAARRMLQYPETLASSPLLRFALERLASGTSGDRVLYYAALPLGKLSTLVLRLQDHWETTVFLRAQRGSAPLQQHPADLEWDDLLHRAEGDSQQKADRNPFGFDNAYWDAHAPEIARQRNMYSGETGLPHPERSTEWTDVELLLRVIRELGGQPLILSLPMKGAFYDYLGVPLATRRATYDRLREIAKAREVPLIDFAEHDTDNHFTIDSGIHLSAKGWVYYARALDAFFHGRQLEGM